MFTDEATFTRKETLNKHNTQIWTLSNLHATRLRAAQRSFSLNVWAGILGDNLIGPYILHCHVDGRTYFDIPKLLEEAHVVLSLRHSVWFQNDGSPSRYTNHVRLHLNVTFGQR